MPRKLRLEFAGACYHVINRGNYRRDVFAPKGAAAAFEQCLFEACARFGWRLHAYVVMRNHFHLAVETPEPNLSTGMKWLQGTWAMRFNRFRGETGRPFQGRYKALHVETGLSLAQVCHYIHLNPVRARVLPAARVAEFPHGSLRWFLRRDRPAALTPATILAESGGLADTAAGWRRYVEYLGAHAEEDAKLKQERFGRLSRGWMVGTAEFRQELQRNLEVQAGDLENARQLGSQLGAEWREELWERRLRAGARMLQIDLERLPARKSAPPKVRLAALLKLSTSVSNGWLAGRLAMGKPASVSQFVRRFQLAGGADERAFRKTLSRVKT